MSKEYFNGINKIKFEGKESDNPLAFKYYNPDQIISGKTMRFTRNNLIRIIIFKC